MDKDRIIIRTYSNVWQFAKKIYAIDSFRLPVPVNPNDLQYFVVGILLTMGVLHVLPFLNGIPFLIKYILIPYCIMKFLTKKKFDGKLPHKFLAGYIEYLLLPKRFSRYQYERPFKKGKFGKVVYREKEIVSITKELMKKKKGGRHVRLSN